MLAGRPMATPRASLVSAASVRAPPAPQPVPVTGGSRVTLRSRARRWWVPAALAVAAGLAAARRRQRRRGRGAVVVSEPGGPKSFGPGNALTLGGLFVALVLYTSNVGFNVFNKQVLNAVPECPLLNTSLHFGVGSLLSLLAWGLRWQPAPRTLSRRAVRSCLLLAALHCSAVFFTNVAISKVNLSLVHTIKAAEPLYAAALSFLVLGKAPPLAAVGACALIAFGVAQASLAEVSFNAVGFSAAMASNLAFCLKNVLSKRSFEGEALDERNFISLLTIGSFALGLPIALAREWPALCASVRMLPAPELMPFFLRAAVAGVLFHVYQIASILILSRASPVTHSVVNTMKRPVLILVAVLFFQTPVGIQNAFGVLCALSGAYLYGRVRS